MAWSILEDGTLPTQGAVGEFSEEEINTLPEPRGVRIDATVVDDLAKLPSDVNPDDSIIIDENVLSMWDGDHIEPLKIILDSNKNHIIFVANTNDLVERANDL